MCVYDRNAFDCGHQEWGTMKAQCTRYWRKCCIRTGHDSFTHQLPGLCHTCQVRRPTNHDIAADDSIHITIKLKPSMAMERAALESANNRPINPADLPTPDNFKSYINSCLKRYQQTHHLPQDSVKVSETDCVPTTGGSRATGDAYHHHSCGLSHPNCKKLEDYQMQIMLLEHQNRSRLMMARAQVDAASTAQGQPVTTPNPEETKFQHYKLQGYQRELMREAMQAKEQPISTTPGQGGIFDPKKADTQGPLKEKAIKNPSLEYQKQNEQAMKNLSLESQKQNEQAMKNLTLEEYQTQLTGLRGANNMRGVLKFQPVVGGCPPGATGEPRLASAEGRRQQQAWNATLPRIAPMTARAPPVPARASIDPSATLANADYLKNRQRRSPIEDYNMQLMLLEQQNRRRLMMARQEQDCIARADAGNTQESGKSMPQTEKSLMLAKPEQEKLAINVSSNAQESEQILEMGSALGAQKGHDKRDGSKMVHSEPIDELDAAMWSTDECDEWSNCEDDMETADKFEV